MSYHFRPATRDPSNLLIGIAGPTGSGKTFSALLLATGIVNVTGGKIAVIDTERGRAKQYAPDGLGYKGFEFLHAELKPPYSSERYQEIYADAEKAAGKGGVVIIDSTSHEHEGTGGLLEQHDSELDRMAGNDFKKRNSMSFAAWAKPKQKRRNLINRLLQANCHLILCFRAKEKTKLVKVNNKTTLVPIGWQPITGDDFPYEMTIMCLMDDQMKGRPIIDTFDAGKCPENVKRLFPTDKPLTQRTGNELAKWAMAGKQEKAAESKPKSEDTVDRATREAHGLETQNDDPVDDLPDEQLIKVIFDPNNDKDFEHHATHKEAAIALGRHMKICSAHLCQELIRKNSTWIGHLEMKFQQRLDDIAMERLQSEQAHG